MRSEPMNGYFNPMHQYSYDQGCPYRDTCPIRTQCPYCPHQTEGNGYINPNYYNMQMEYYQQNYERNEYPYQSIVPEQYGHENLYPISSNNSVNVGNYEYDNISPQYNNYGYINPEENIHSPWDNNRMYNQNSVNQMPIPCPYR